MASRSKKPQSASRTPTKTFPGNAWEHILASLEEGLIVIDQSQQIASINPTAATLIGQSEAHVDHQSYAHVFTANPWIIAIIERTLDTHSHTAAEGILLGGFQQATSVRITCSPIFNDKTRLPSFLGLVLVFHNLSYQKELAEEVQRQDRLAHLGVVAAGLAHEIKNPLAGIRGAAQLLQGRLARSHSDQSSVEYTTIMIREIDRLSTLLEQLLQLNSPLRFEPQSINVHKVLSDVLLLERETAPFEVDIQTHFDPSLPNVLGDEASLAQVFRNLIKNGLQALNGRRHGRLTLSTRMATDFHFLRSEQHSNPVNEHQLPQLSHYAPHRVRFLSVDFMDNGPGITASHLPQLFTPFFTTKSQGTGLGLPVSQQIVAQHGGTIRVDSEPGQGARFHVYLPVSPE
jgi:two-component system nitrogen regulation sensor histidine kinase GlnL